MPSDRDRGTRAKIRQWQDVPWLKLQQMKPDAILVLNNLCPDHATEVRELLDQAGIGLVYLPRHSPEFNPIEHAWVQMKERLKAEAARSIEVLEAELKPALNTVTAQDARGWIRYAGYALHRSLIRFSRTTRPLRPCHLRLSLSQCGDPSLVTPVEAASTQAARLPK
jgi:hypothetical protein